MPALEKNNNIDLDLDDPKILQIVRDSYNSHIANFTGLSQVLQESVTGLNKFTSQIVQIQKSINSFLPDIKKFLNTFEDFKKFHELEKKVLIESGWFICPSLDDVPYHFFSKAVVNYNSGRKDSITRLMKEIYGENNWTYLEKTIATWDKNKFFTKQRMKIINDAFEAHKEGKYTLSIPALLPIIEGICFDFCKKNKIKIRYSASLGKAKTIAKSLQKNEQYVSELITFFIENQLYVHTDTLKTSKNKKYLNRHAILHGSSSGYPDCARSLRCFLLLDVLTLLK